MVVTGLPEKAPSVDIQITIFFSAGCPCITVDDKRGPLSVISKEGLSGDGQVMLKIIS
jgi:hypothetical protein